MTKQKRNPMEDVTKRVRDFLDELERLLQPKRDPARVPVPVRVNEGKRRLPRR